MSSCCHRCLCEESLTCVGKVFLESHCVQREGQGFLSPEESFSCSGGSTTDSIPRLSFIHRLFSDSLLCDGLKEIRPKKYSARLCSTGSLLISQVLNLLFIDGNINRR